MLLQSVDLCRCGRDEHGKLLEPLEAILWPDVVVVVSFGRNVYYNANDLHGHQAQNDDDDYGDNLHSCSNTHMHTSFSALTLLVWSYDL